MPKIFPETSIILRAQGFALAPILLIIALFAVIAVAIAAGSGGFSSGTSADTARANAAAVISIGDNLKSGVDVLAGRGVDTTTIDFGTSNTTCSNCLFSPTGGGITKPSTSLSGVSGTTAANIAWDFTTNRNFGMGASGDDIVAFMPVPLSTCLQINYQLWGNADQAAATLSLAITVTPSALPGGSASFTFGGSDVATIRTAVKNSSSLFFKKNTACIVSTVTYIGGGHVSGLYYRALTVG